MEFACEFIQDAGKWSRFEWMSKWEDLKDFIGKVLFPDHFAIFCDRGFKISGYSYVESSYFHVWFPF